MNSKHKTRKQKHTKSNYFVQLQKTVITTKNQTRRIKEIFKTRTASAFYKYVAMICNSAVLLLLLGRLLNEETSIVKLKRPKCCNNGRRHLVCLQQHIGCCSWPSSQLNTKLAASVKHVCLCVAGQRCASSAVTDICKHLSRHRNSPWFESAVFMSISQIWYRKTNTYWHTKYNLCVYAYIHMFPYLFV